MKLQAEFGWIHIDLVTDSAHAQNQKVLTKGSNSETFLVKSMKGDRSKNHCKRAIIWPMIFLHCMLAWYLWNLTGDLD